MKQEEELLLNDYCTVGIIFSPTSKVYTYKVDKSLELEEDDFVVVLADSLYKVVQVKEIHDEINIDFESTLDYKYVIDKVDFTKYEELKDRSKLIKKTLDESKRRSLKTSLVNQFKDGLDDKGQKQLKEWL